MLKFCFNKYFKIKRTKTLFAYWILKENPSTLFSEVFGAQKFAFQTLYDMRKYRKTISDYRICNNNNFTLFLIYYLSSCKKVKAFFTNNAYLLSMVDNICHLINTWFVMIFYSCFKIVTLCQNNTLFNKLDTKFILTDIEGDFCKYFT